MSWLLADVDVFKVTLIAMAFVFYFLDVIFKGALRGELPSIVASLVIMAGPEKGRSFSLGTSTLIGRDPVLCDIVLPDTQVSRQHAKIRLEGDQFHVYDLASSNGTFVNGEIVSRAELHDGDRISMGGTELEFKRA